MRLSFGVKLLLLGLLLTVGSCGTCTVLLGASLSNTPSIRGMEALGQAVMYAFVSGLGLMVIGTIVAVAQAIAGAIRRRNEPPEPPEPPYPPPYPPYPPPPPPPPQQ